MVITELPKTAYKSYQLQYEYVSNKYYEVIVKDGIFNIELKLKDFEHPVVRRFSGELYEDYFEDGAIAYRLENDDETIGFLEISIEQWSNRLRITNLLIFEKYRNQKYGTLLLDKAKKVAHKQSVREIVLETQTCNYPALQAYFKNGFRINGIDLSCYSNKDVALGEVRLELVFPILSTL